MGRLPLQLPMGSMHIIDDHLVQQTQNVAVEQTGSLAGIVPVTLIGLQAGSRQSLTDLARQVAEKPFH